MENSLTKNSDIDRITKEFEKFFVENNTLLNKNIYFEKFKDELCEENTSKLSVDNYIQNIQNVLFQAKNISDKRENEFNESIKKLNFNNTGNKIN